MSFIRYNLWLFFVFILSYEGIAQTLSVELGFGGLSIGCSPLTVNFNINTVSGNPPSTTYVLDFGDGSPVINYTQSNIPATVSHIYTDLSCGETFTTGVISIPNSFGATLVATNAGSTNSGSAYPIRISQKPNASFLISPPVVCAGQPVTFTNNSNPGVVYTSAGACDSMPKFYWLISGPSAGAVTSGLLGTDNGFPNNAPAWTTGSSPLTMQFTTPGSYQMKLSTGNSCGIDDTTLNFCVVAQPQPQFSVNPATSCYPPALNVAATNSTVVPSNACFPTTYAYNWSVSPASGWF